MRPGQRYGERLGKRVHPASEPSAVGEITIDLGRVVYVRWLPGGPRLIGQWFKPEDLSEATP